MIYGNRTDTRCSTRFGILAKYSSRQNFGVCVE
jgi:hypothetical protein